MIIILNDSFKANIFPKNVIYMWHRTEFNFSQSVTNLNMNNEVRQMNTIGSHHM